MEMNEITAQKMQQLGQIIKREIPGLGFCVLVFPFYNTGIASYVSNGNKQDMIKVLRETADRLEGNKTFPTING